MVSKRADAQSYLVLVRHAFPAIDPGQPAHQWPLSDEGRRRCRPLAQQLAVYNPQQVLTSTEVKAVETGSLVAQFLGLPCSALKDLHEHERLGVPYVGQAAFEAQIAEFFANPDRLVFGQETARQAYQRYAQAIDRALRQYAGQNLVLVSHGTVMTLWLAQAVGLDPFPFWKRLGLPGFVVLLRPGHSIVSVVELV
jgi:broad specificity phosphatase PhoE